MSKQENFSTSITNQSQTTSQNVITSSSASHNINNSNTGEQPKTKRQKIEKIKKNANHVPTSTSQVTSPTCSKILTIKPPDILDTGGNVCRSLQQLPTQNSQPQCCSSLNSSLHSLTTTHSSSSANNSPNSTPSNSRTASLSQLLNVQNTMGEHHILQINGSQQTKNISPTSSSNCSSDIKRTKDNIKNIYSISSTNSNSKSISNSNSNIHSSKNSSSSIDDKLLSSLSTDELDRIIVNNNKMPDLLPIHETIHQKDCGTNSNTNSNLVNEKVSSIIITTNELIAAENMREFEDSLVKQCLCGVSERSLQKPFQSHYSFNALGQKRIAALSEWPTNKLLQFLSNLQLLFDIYLKQNSKGFICVTIMDVCNAIIRNERKLIDEIIVLAGYNNAYVQFLAARVLSSFLVIAKQELDDNWLKKLVDNLFDNERLDDLTIKKIHFSLDIIKRIVEWKDIDLHPLEDEIVDQRSNAGITNNVNSLNTNNRTEQQNRQYRNNTHNDIVIHNSDSHISDNHNDHDHGLLDSLSYMHFRPQEPTLENNYFAVHFLQNTEQENIDINTVRNLYHQRFNDAATNLLNYPNSSSEAHSSRYNNDDYQEDLSGGDDDDDILEDLHEDDVVIENDTNDLDEIDDADLLQNAARCSSGLAALQRQYANFNHFSSSSQSMQTNSQIRTPAVSFSRGFESSSGSHDTSCNIIPLTDSESFDTTHLKCVTIKILEDGWPALVRKMSVLITNHMEAEDAENCILNFLQLWENIISVKANLSVVKTLPFCAQLDKFEKLLNQNLCCTVYKQMLCLFNEALCYGSTLALQDILPDETCQLAHQIIRHVKDFRILESLPRRHPENIVSFLGFKKRPVMYPADSMESHSLSDTQNQQHDEMLEMDKTILQKMVLLVLKSIAVSVKEIRSDSSDSSIDSTDYDAFQDMVLIERSIRDVLRKLENFIKHTLEFHPDCHFSKILIHLFDDQDDHLIEAMVCTLDVTSGISFRNNAFPELLAMLNPVYTFLEFLKMISNSSDLLLDLLVSNETCFLLYLLRFLKFIRMNWQMFVQSCHDFAVGSNVLDEAMSVLIRLRLQISRLVSRQLYPYEISPVLRLLESCESLYEGNELI